MVPATISPSDLFRRYQSGSICDLIDVRTPVEFRGLHVEFARNIPLDQLEPKVVMAKRNGSSGEPLYLICQGGTRSQNACEKFRQAGYENVVSVEGGTVACEQASLPMVRGKKAMSLERQVRIVAGSLVLIGVLLGWFVHPTFFGLSAFVGAGLVFAGVTDTCGMGMVLAKMPWNQCSQDSDSTCPS
jgi:rhodanese-related sulfurtransferase